MSNRKKSGSKFGFALLIIAIIALSVTALTMNNVFWMLLCGFACVVITAVASVLYFRKRYIETDHNFKSFDVKKQNCIFIFLGTFH